MLYISKIISKDIITKILICDTPFEQDNGVI